METDHLNHTYDHTTTTSTTYHNYGLPVVTTLSLILVIAMIMAFVGNVMVIMTILKHRGMRTRTNMLLGNLAVADILVAVVDMPIALVTLINHDWVFPEAYCVLNGFFVGLGLMLSVHTLMWISSGDSYNTPPPSLYPATHPPAHIHKFISITGPINRNVTQTQILMVMIISWVWTILYNLTATPLIGMSKTVTEGSFSFVPFVIPETLPRSIIPSPVIEHFSSKLLLQEVPHDTLPDTRITTQPNTFCNLVIPMIVMFYCYYKIFKAVKDHLVSMREVGMRCDSLIQQKQIAITLFIVLIVFFMCWLPYIGYSMSLVFCGESCVPLIANPISYLLGYMNSACNPVIYALRSPSFRGSFKDIICGTSSRIPGSGHTNASWRSVPSLRDKDTDEDWYDPQRDFFTYGDFGNLYEERSPVFEGTLPLPLRPIASPVPPVVTTKLSPLPEAWLERGSMRNFGGTRTSEGMVGNMLVSFRKSIMRSTDRDLKQQGSVSRPARVAKSVVVYNTTVCPKVTTEARRVEANKADPETACETPPPTVHFTGENHTAPLPPARTMDIKPLYDPWKPLQPQFPINHLTRSCQEIAACSSGLMTRSASAGALTELAATAKATQEKDDVTSKRRHRSEVHRPLMWKASVDHLTPLPVLGRKRRRVGEGQRSLVQQHETPLQTHLRVRTLIRNVRKSLSDLFIIRNTDGGARVSGAWGKRTARRHSTCTHPKGLQR
ncbi:Melanopsin [Chionoecetes opilio]|uniref:Melanopsin n=1 Tax=Chionoecetes opilio TaxID=41210 RepID=A0A8J4YJM5_CHIOP|nr:Melanopsin [Chionoecetes opilio]